MAAVIPDQSRSDFEDLLHCMICFEQYSTPKMLHCGHTFCADCLIGYHQTYQQQKRAVHGKLPCPTCRELTTLPGGGVSGLKNDFKVKKIEEMFKTMNIKNRVSTKVCDPCKVQKKSSPATCYCPNCAMSYCSSCLKKHDKNPVFKSHRVVNDKDRQQLMQFVCRVHPDEQGRYFCSTCGVVVCTICIVQGHEGHDVKEVDSLLKQQQEDIHNLKNIVETRLSRLRNVAVQLEDLRQVNLNLCQQAEIEIKEKTKRMMAELRQQENKLLDELRNRRDDKMQKISKELDRVQFHVGKAISLSNYAKNTMRRGSLQTFAVHDEFIQRMRTVAEADAATPDGQFFTIINFLPGRQEPSIGRIDETRVPPDEVARQASAPSSSGRGITRHISLNHKSKKPQLLLHLHQYGTKPGAIRDPLGVICLLNGDLAVAEWGNKRVQLFDAVGKSVELIGAGQLQAPQGVAVTLKGNIIVSDGELKRLQVFSPSGSGLAQWGLGKFFTPCGIAISPNGHCIVTDTGEHSVSIYQGEKTCLKRFGSEGSSDTRFKNPLYVTTGNHNEIIVSDSDNHCVKVFDSRGEFKLRFGGLGSGDGHLHFPRGVCCDNEGNIVVADRNNSRICLFSRSGRFIRHLVTKVDGIQDPYAVALSITGNLVVTESASKRAAIKMFEL
ncbi:hypothetical protein LSH36_274g00031 [Paralvinella palmiformis]|uniref:Uncharacterized protein n=1 Tax=Paralvinella palmiformis TaxID=53620 RepID=A0AAD9N1Z8_9ANNE|nr:hypothetical protein LSH36_274g00031 [Paralvinella palmiformis]